MFTQHENMFMYKRDKFTSDGKDILRQQYILIQTHTHT